MKFATQISPLLNYQINAIVRIEFPPLVDMNITLNRPKNCLTTSLVFYQNKTKQNYFKTVAY